MRNNYLEYFVLYYKKIMTFSTSFEIFVLCCFPMQHCFSMVATVMAVVIASMVGTVRMVSTVSMFITVSMVSIVCIVGMVGMVTRRHADNDLHYHIKVMLK